MYLVHTYRGSNIWPLKQKQMDSKIDKKRKKGELKGGQHSRSKQFACSMFQRTFPSLLLIFLSIFISILLLIKIFLPTNFKKHQDFTFFSPKMSVIKKSLSKTSLILKNLPFLHVLLPFS